MLTFHYCSRNYPLGEAMTVGLTDIHNLNINGGNSDIVITKLRVLHFRLICLYVILYITCYIIIFYVLQIKKRK